MLSLKTNGLDKHAKGMSLHSGYFDTASWLIYQSVLFFGCDVLVNLGAYLSHKAVEVGVGFVGETLELGRDDASFLEVSEDAGAGGGSGLGSQEEGGNGTYGGAAKKYE